jgi:hypothetical protein
MSFKILLKSFTVFYILLTLNGYSKEGMYLPMLLQKINASEMEAMGMRITAEEIYSLNQPSLKDAIVQFGNGCTGEIVSSQGLLLTNHHCGYRSIQQHSTIDHDYLTDGFWAVDNTKELPNQGLTASILQSMVDVSKEILNGITDKMTEIERSTAIARNIEAMLVMDVVNPFLKVEIKPFYYGNQYIMLTSLVFKDVRLVGAPPSNIGKFGGDTDNWMWPRHTGDFSVFRIYADKDNKPADYSKSNIPYSPVKFLDISLKGYEKGDFTFVFGYPGSTQEYLPSSAIKMITETVNPFKIDLRRQKLDIMQKYMEKDPNIRIQYSAKYAGVANGWKKWIGENKGIKRLNTIQNKIADEEDFIRWSKAQSPEYLGLMSAITSVYNNTTPYELAYQYFLETAYYQDIVRYVSQYFMLVQHSSADKFDETGYKSTHLSLLNGVDGFYRDYNIEVEKELMIANIEAIKRFPYDGIAPPEIISVINKKFNGNTKRYVDYLFSNSLFSNPLKLKKFLEDYKSTKYKKLVKDPFYQLTSSLYSHFQDNVRPQLIKNQLTIDSLQRIYMSALLIRAGDNYLFPDANSTLRVSYGLVDNYEPRDGVIYNHFTTLDGIMDKENPEIYDYVVVPKLKTLYQSKNYGRYEDKDKSLHTCFIASNHTTGGNSGSPVLNAQGRLIGINFDRNWEGTMSDLDYDPDQCRNIMIDIRYCLFIIDNFAEAHRLIEEMSIVE